MFYPPYYFITKADACEVDHHTEMTEQCVLAYTRHGLDFEAAGGGNRNALVPLPRSLQARGIRVLVSPITGENGAICERLA